MCILGYSGFLLNEKMPVYTFVYSFLQKIALFDKKE